MSFTVGQLVKFRTGFGKPQQQGRIEASAAAAVQRSSRPAAGQAGAALVSSEEMARLLGLSLARFRGLYRANPLVWASRVELGGRGSGQELRWDPAKVTALLQRRGS